MLSKLEMLGAHFPGSQRLVQATFIPLAPHFFYITPHFSLASLPSSLWLSRNDGRKEREKLGSQMDSGR
jgi:hypothetical protein